MNNIIKAFFYGELSPYEKRKCTLEENRKKLKEFVEYDEAFANELDREKRMQFEKILDQKMDTVEVEHYDAFYDGFIYGTNLMIEIIIGKKYI